jgi:hypothetical protein
VSALVSSRRAHRWVGYRSPSRSGR